MVSQTGLMKPYILRIVGAALVAAAVASPAEIRKESGDLTVSVVESEAKADWPRLQIARRGGGLPVSLELDRTSLVKDFVFVGSKRIVVLGELGSGGDILTVVDTDRGQVVDRLWGRNATISPDQKFVAYGFRIPPAIGQTRLSPALVAYDLTAAPTVNTMSSPSDNPEERGIVLYPEGHRLSQRHWIVLEPGQPDRRYVSPIAWSADSKAIAVIEHEEPTRDVRLVVVDISRGLRHPTVTVTPIGYGQFLDASFWSSVPSEYVNSYPSFKELRFSEDGQEVTMTSWRMGPFAEKAVTQAVPATVR